MWLCSFLFLDYAFECIWFDLVPRRLGCQRWDDLCSSGGCWLRPLEFESHHISTISTWKSLQFDLQYFFFHGLDSSILRHQIPLLNFSQEVKMTPTITLFTTGHTFAQHFSESWPTTAYIPSTHPANTFHPGDPTRSNTYIIIYLRIVLKSHTFPIWSILMPG